MPKDYGVEEKTLVDCLRRESVLRALADGPVEREDVEEAAGVSESTAYRLMGSLVERGIAEKVGEGSDAYALTPVGEAVLDETDRFRETVGRLSCMDSIVSSVRGTDVEFDPSLFKHGIVTVSDEGQPYAPARRLTDLVGSTDGMRLLAVSAASTIFFGGAGSPASVETEVEVVCPETVAETCVEKMSREEVEKNLTIRVHDDPPLTVALFDERVAVGAHDSESGTLDVLVDTGSRDAYGWGEGVYERYRTRAEAYL